MGLADTSRIGTAAAISRRLFPGPEAHVVVATAENYPDALAGAPLTGALGIPTLLVPRDTLPAVVTAELQRLETTRVTILGGPAAVSPRVEQALRAQVGTVDRVAGTTRFDTAARIGGLVRALQPGSVVYLATGRGFADALAGGPLANGPILLTEPDALPVETRIALARLHPDRVVVFGGPVAVADTVLEQVRLATSASVSRVWGPDRYATAAAIARWFSAPAPMVLVATGQNFPDALAGAGAAAALGVPVVLVQHDAIPASARDQLERLRPAAIGVLGGDAAISDEVIGRLRGHLR